MLEKLYNMGCLDYQRLIRMFSSKLELSSNASFVLMSILDNYHTNPNINSTNLAAYMGKSKAEVEESIVELLNLDYIQIQLVMKMVNQLNPIGYHPFLLSVSDFYLSLKTKKRKTILGRLIRF